MVTGYDIASILPFGIVSLFGIIVLMLEAFQRPSFGREYISYVAALGFAVAGGVTMQLDKLGLHTAFGGAAYLDGFAIALTLLFCAAGFLTSLLAPAYLKSHGVDRGEYYALTLFAAGGMMLMASAGDLVTFFVALEIQSVAIYGLAAYLRRSPRSAEAGMKYFLLGAFATGLMLYGIALIYGATGSTNLAVIGDVLAMGAGSGDAIAATARNAAMGAAAGLSPTDLPASSNITGVLGHIPLLAIGVVLVVVGFSVKVAAVPFHMWAPDVYTGSPTPMVGFMASAVKAAGFAAMFRVFAVALFDDTLRMGPYGWVQVVFWISLLSMVLGNLVALTQTNVKRMLAFSSVAHAGYLMIAICAMGYGDGNIDFGSGIVFYSFAYTFGTIGAFGVLSWFGKRGEEAETFDDLNGLGFSQPWLGAVLSLFMLSSAGIPPAAGFIGKFMIFNSAVEAAATGSAAGTAGANMLYVLVVVGILTSVAGVAYYLRVLVHLYMKKPLRDVPAIPAPGAKLAIALCAIATLWFGIFPGKLTTLSTDSVAQMLDRGDGVAAVELVSED